MSDVFAGLPRDVQRQLNARFQYLEREIEDKALAQPFSVPGQRLVLESRGSLPPPTSLQVQTNPLGGIELSWAASPVLVRRYEVQISESVLFEDSTIPIETHKNRLTFLPPVPGEEYFARVRVIDIRFQVSPWTATINIQTGLLVSGDFDFGTFANPVEWRGIALSEWTNPVVDGDPNNQDFSWPPTGPALITVKEGSVVFSFVSIKLGWATDIRNDGIGDNTYFEMVLVRDGAVEVDRVKWHFMYSGGVVGFSFAWGPMALVFPGIGLPQVLNEGQHSYAMTMSIHTDGSTVPDGPDRLRLQPQELQISLLELRGMA